MVGCKLEHALNHLKNIKKTQIVGGKDRIPDLQPLDPLWLRWQPLEHAALFVMIIITQDNIYKQSTWPEKIKSAQNI